MGSQPHLQLQSRLFALPRELRDIIYAYSTSTTDGYRFNPQTHRLILVDGRCINFSLMHSCRLVAIEVQGLHLKLNTVHFWTTCFRGDNHVTSQSFDRGLHYYFSKLCVILTEAQSYIDDDVISYVAETHPLFLPHILQIQAVRQYSTSEADIWGEVGSLYRRFAYGTLQQILHGPNSAGMSNLIHRHHESMEDVKKWTIETLPEWRISKEALVDFSLFETDRDGTPQRISAAAAAISFMSALPPKTKKEIQAIVLHEDQKTDAWPECHSQGLIPFCQENPHLRIEHEVSLWGSILPAASGDFSPMDDLTLFELYSNNVTKRGLRPWITDALALNSLGMPMGAYKLVLDGDPCSDLATEIFAIVQRDASWQILFEQHNMDNSPPRSERWSEIRENFAYIAKGFPGAIRDIVEGRSIVKCNFPTRSNLDANGNHISEDGQVIKVDASWNFWQWGMHWDVHSVKGYKVRTLESGAVNVQCIPHD